MTPLSYNFPFFEWLLRWGEIIGALGSILLSLALAVLYYQQYNLLKIERTPSLEVSDSEINGDELILKVSNYKEGLAKNLRLRTTVEYPLDEGVNMASDTRNPNSVERFTLEHNIHRYEDCKKLRERGLMGPERNVEFRGEPPFTDPSGNGFGNFNSGVGNALRDDIYEFSFWVDVVYETEFGEELTEPVTHPGRWFTIEPEKGKELINRRPNEVTFEFVYNHSALAASRVED